MISSELESLGHIAAASDETHLDAAQTLAQVRQSIACFGFASISEVGVLPPYGRAALAKGPSDTEHDAMARAFALGTLGAASDLDPLDQGPAHLALPATAAVLALQELHPGKDHLVAIGTGIEVASRLRASAPKVRPGIGFHSAGTFGLLAAAVASARLLGLDGQSIASAMAIALTRTAGLAVNNARTRVGLTHFGYAAAHGVEAAILAADGWDASRDLDSAFGTLFGSQPDPVDLSTGVWLTAKNPPAYKHYPCNIYINLAIEALRRVDGDEGAITVVMPPVMHLDWPAPRNVRELRNSVQGSVAAALMYGPTYNAFTESNLHVAANGRLAESAGRVVVEFDPTRPTGLGAATVSISTARGETATSSMSDLLAWDAAVVERLADGLMDKTAAWRGLLFDGDPLAAYDAIVQGHKLEATHEG